MPGPLLLDLSNIFNAMKLLSLYMAKLLLSLKGGGRACGHLASGKSVNY
jgi:hypothetical protein